METKVWYPSLTSQFLICPVPFHFDTYRGCQYNCSYCFARDFVTFSRRKSEHKESTYLIGNTPASFMKWMNKVDKQNEHNYNKGEEVAIKERIPIKIGATADPFPYIEAKERITHDILSTLDLFNYPTEIQTKNPEILASYCDEFKDANWTIAVTLISTDEEFIKICEPNAPSAQSRLDAIKKLTDKGFKVMVKIQPAIYPKVLADLPLLIKKVAEAGCWAVNIEGLKIRISMPKEEQKLFQTIGDYLNLDLRDLYRTKGKKTGSDWEMSKELKQFYIDEAISHCKEHKIKCFIADNDMGKIGDGHECCGTEVLKDYKIWGCNSRTRSWGLADNESHELGKCVVNFTRSYDSKKPQTMNEVAQKYMLPDWVEEAQENHRENEEFAKHLPPTDVSMIHTSFPGKTREYFDASPTLSTACGGGHLPYIKSTTDNDKPVQSDGIIRRLTPVEYERLQGFPMSEESVIIALCKNNCADQIKNCVNVENSKLNLLKYVGNAGSVESRGNVVFAEEYLSLKNQRTKKLVPPNVLISCGEGTAEIHSQGKSQSLAPIVEKQEKSLHPIDIEDFALIIAGINLIVGLIINNGTAESHQSEICSIIQENGERLVKLSGSGTMRLVEYVEKSLTTPRKHFKSITLKHSDINALEQELLTLFSYVCIAIDGYIPKGILTENILAIKMTTIHGYSKYGLSHDGKLRPISDSQRYKCLGNAVSVPVIKAVAMRLLPYLLEEQGEPNG